MKLFIIPYSELQAIKMAQNLSHLIHKYYLEIWCKFILDFHGNNQYRKNVKNSMVVFPYFIDNTTIYGKFSAYYHSRHAMR